MKKRTRKTVAYLVLVFSISILLMALWICLGNDNLPKVLLYTGVVILYIATFAGLLRGIIWTVEHFVRWIDRGDDSDVA